MIAAILVILGFQLAGEVVTRAFDLSLPGPVLGMAGLLVTFLLVPRSEVLVRPVAQGLLSHLSLLFVPAGVGVVAHLPLLRQEGVALALALLLSTAAAIAVGAWVFVLVARLTERGPR